MFVPSHSAEIGVEGFILGGAAGIRSVSARLTVLNRGRRVAPVSGHQASSPWRVSCAEKVEALCMFT